MNPTPSTFVYTTFIRSTREKVFDAIVRPEVARRYWGHENVSAWTPGADWQHIRADDARTLQLVGKVVEISRPSTLVMTWANASQKDDPAAFSRVRFDIVEYEGMVRLTVTHDELQAGSGMDQGIRKGWPIVLSSMKSYLETGDAIDIFAKPLVSA
ncbi:SRPBCC family protein [Ramlibacter sp.]|uniref:SRPBCC family protein n=1 Tax=Ramlibacter sp. TaxID=1917967 RepID=UPI003D0E1326